ncbi:MAG: bifunctional phosphoglucose/phosphomannose isomerase [Candidatus Heimdallarchaeaceae archaeon]
MSEFELPEQFKWKNQTIKYKKPRNVIICGMGGSVIAGDYLIKLFEKELSIPVITSRGYHLPQFVDKDSLVICISYSGNTEETLSRYHEALLKGTMIISISSSGALEQISKEIGVPHIKLREGFPPRCSFPLIYISLISVFERLGLISNQDHQIAETISVLEKLSLDYGLENSTKSNLAKTIAYGLFNTLPVFIGHGIFSPVAIRAKCELNENSKILAINEEIPEHNHNAIVALDNPSNILNHVAFIFFRDTDEEKTIKLRIKETMKLVSEKTEKILVISPLGEFGLTKQFSVTYLVDFISIYLAFLHEIDPTVTPSIDKLKNILKTKINLTEELSKKIIKK